MKMVIGLQEELKKHATDFYMNFFFLLMLLMFPFMCQVCFP